MNLILSLSLQDGRIDLDHGQTVMLRCSSQGDPPPFMMWEVDGSTISKPAPSWPQRYNQIEVRFSQINLPRDRYEIVCVAAGFMQEHRIRVQIYNKRLERSDEQEEQPPWPATSPPEWEPPHLRERHQKSRMERRQERLRQTTTPRSALNMAAPAPNVSGPAYDPKRGNVAATSAGAQFVAVLLHVVVSSLAVPQ